jgi:sugar/nucleoside kinase (ribokinase family)
MKTFDILGLGNPMLDTVLSVDEMPANGGKVRGRLVGHFPGGTVANVLCAASKLGAMSAIYGSVGRDGEGDFLAADLVASGVATKFLQRAERDRSGFSMIMVGGDGEKSLVFVPRPELPLDERILLEASRLTRVIYHMPSDAGRLRSIYRIARQAGALVAVDLEPA